MGKDNCKKLIVLYNLSKEYFFIICITLVLTAFLKNIYIEKLKLEIKKLSYLLMFFIKFCFIWLNSFSVSIPSSFSFAIFCNSSAIETEGLDDIVWSFGSRNWSVYVFLKVLTCEYPGFLNELFLINLRPYPLE